MDWETENGILMENGNIREDFVAGADEAGRGPFAGAVFAAAVMLPYGCVIEGLRDSKKVSPKRRDLLYEKIKSEAAYFRIASASVEEIEVLNIQRASMLAMRRAVDGLGVKPDCLLIDGVTDNGFGEFQGVKKCIVRGDDSSPNIAAASILAKVARDRYMEEMDKKYPQYGFARNKGYGTKFHIEMILKYGPCEIHRRSFLKKLYLRQTEKMQIELEY